MPKLKAPVFSLAAQGKLGPIHLSHHSGETYAYGSNPRSQVPPTPAQEIVRKDFTNGAELWSTFTPAEKWFWTILAPRLYQPREKDCKKGRITGYNLYMRFWREIGDQPEKLLIFMATWLAIAATYGIPMP